MWVVGPGAHGPSVIGPTGPRLADHRLGRRYNTSVWDADGYTLATDGGFLRDAQSASAELPAISMWRDGRVVDGGGLENQRRRQTPRRLRQIPGTIHARGLMCQWTLGPDQSQDAPEFRRRVVRGWHPAREGCRLEAPVASPHRCFPLRSSDNPTKIGADSGVIRAVEGRGQTRDGDEALCSPRHGPKCFRSSLRGGRDG
jgi:hypothetical protein